MPAHLQTQGKRAEGVSWGTRSSRRSRRIDGVGIVTLAPEMAGGLDLVRDLVLAGHRVSLGHTGAIYGGARCHCRGRESRHSSLQSQVVDHFRSPGVVGAVLNRMRWRPRSFAMVITCILPSCRWRFAGNRWRRVAVTTARPSRVADRLRSRLATRRSSPATRPPCSRTARLRAAS